jgi:6-pyruvoyltetrahydropterin/6-carboxytetrahydropterin synthase
MEIFQSFTFEAAHRLPAVAPEHKCSRLHGHSYRVEVWLEGPVDPATGWVVDFAEIELAFAPLLQELDHHCLNDIPSLKNPTSENLATWILGRLGPSLPALDRVVVRETSDSGAVARVKDL